MFILNNFWGAIIKKETHWKSQFPHIKYAKYPESNRYIALFQSKVLNLKLFKERHNYLEYKTNVLKMMQILTINWHGTLVAAKCYKTVSDNLV